MPLLDQLRPLYKTAQASVIPGLDDLGAFRHAAHAAYRTAVVPLYGPEPSRGSVRSVNLPGAAGASLSSRIYWPSDSEDVNMSSVALPVHVYLHGGGFWSGEPGLFDVPCLRLAIDAQCAVVSIGYRLAPEHRFPTAVDDAYIAMQWISDNATVLGVDPSRMSIGGASAGGGLAAAVAVRCRDGGGPDLVLQILEVPAVDLRPGQLPTLDPDGDPYALDELMATSERYLGDLRKASDPMASPALVDDLTRLPPTLIMTAEYDPLREPAEAFAERLRVAGVRVAIRMWPGQFHGSQRFETLIPGPAHAYHRQVVDALLEAYRPA